MSSRDGSTGSQCRQQRECPHPSSDEGIRRLWSGIGVLPMPQARHVIRAQGACQAIAVNARVGPSVSPVLLVSWSHTTWPPAVSRQNVSPIWRSFPYVLGRFPDCASCLHVTGSGLLSCDERLRLFPLASTWNPLSSKLRAPPRSW